MKRLRSSGSSSPCSGRSPPPPPPAHPLGNFTVNQFTRIEPSGRRVYLVTVALDMAEIPTFQARDEVRAPGARRRSRTGWSSGWMADASL